MSLLDLDFCEQSHVPKSQCRGCRESVGGVSAADPARDAPNPSPRPPEGTRPLPSGPPSFPSPSGHPQSSTSPPALTAPAGGAHQAAASGAERVRSMDCEGLDYARGWLDEEGW